MSVFIYLTMVVQTELIIALFLKTLILNSNTLKIRSLNEILQNVHKTVQEQ